MLLNKLPQQSYLKIIISFDIQ